MGWALAVPTHTGHESTGCTADLEGQDHTWIQVFSKDPGGCGFLSAVVPVMASGHGVPGALTQY